MVVALALFLSGESAPAASRGIGKNEHAISTKHPAEPAQYQQQQVPLATLQSVQAAFLEALRGIVTKAEAQPKQHPTEPEHWYSPSVNKGLFLVGFVYTVFAGLQWWTIRTQIQLQSRPRLIVRNVVHQEPMVRGFPVSGQFYVANVGDSRATITESLSMVYWGEDPLPMRRPYEGKNGNGTVAGKLEAGATQTGIFASDGVLDVIHLAITSPKEVAPLARETALYVMGWIEYKDTRKVTRRTAFCRRFDPNIKRFVAIQDPDYEHAE